MMLPFICWRFFRKCSVFIFNLTIFSSISSNSSNILFLPLFSTLASLFDFWMQIAQRYFRSFLILYKIGSLTWVEQNTPNFLLSPPFPPKLSSEVFDVDWITLSTFEIGFLNFFESLGQTKKPGVAEFWRHLRQIGWEQGSLKVVLDGKEQAEQGGGRSCIF